MLTDIIELLNERGVMSLRELACHFHVELSAMEGMLHTLAAKNRIEKLDTTCSGCGGCVLVKPEDAAMYRAVKAR